MVDCNVLSIAVSCVVLVVGGCLPFKIRWLFFVVCCLFFVVCCVLVDVVVMCFVCC